MQIPRNDIETSFTQGYILGVGVMIVMFKTKSLKSLPLEPFPEK